ncbi:MAG TPA: tetratricopeptide repeat protein, partial [Pilimelia sp.]|nr:tetratricopeptide repeat protein [Pilimelia sp.]
QPDPSDQPDPSGQPDGSDPNDPWDRTHRSDPNPADPTDPTDPADAMDPTSPAGPNHAAGPPAPAPPVPDPEALLAAYRWHLHPETLREVVPDADELTDIHEQLTTRLGSATDNSSRARLLGLRCTVSRVLGDLGKAFADGKLALAHAQATGEAADIATAKARLAPVLQWRGEYDKADRLFLEADVPGLLPGHLRAAIHESAGRSCYEQGRYLEACDHFGLAVRCGPPDDLDLIGRLEVALDAVFVRVVRTGWGPYPRAREAILPPAPAATPEPAPTPPATPAAPPTPVPAAVPTAAPALPTSHRRSSAHPRSGSGVRRPR